MVELDGLGRAKQGQQDRSYWTLARVVERILLRSSNDQLLTIRVSVLCLILCGLLWVCPKAPKYVMGLYKGS